MKKLAIFLTILGVSAIAYPQFSAVKSINALITPATALDPLKYLASDELKGRSARRPEIHVAAKYLSDQLKKAGVRPVATMTDYFQNFELKLLLLANSGSLQISDSLYTIGKNLLQVDGTDIDVQAPIVFAGYGNENDLSSLDVKGKIVITNFGNNDSSATRAAFTSMKTKSNLLRQRGAIALVERFWQKDIPWSTIQTAYAHERVVLQFDSLPTFLINTTDTSFIASIHKSPLASLSSTGNAMKSVAAKNIMGYVPGTDNKLKEQFIALSAHYDHIGVADPAQTVDGKIDSIYNGARDNAIGVTAVINAAKYFAKNPPKRSILFILFTGEELGLLGSRYFAEHPTVPFKNIVYNLNCDNGGYNDTSVVTVIGLGRTSGDDDIQKASLAYGLKAIADPLPELNLFDRSDNLNLAIQGIPAPTFGMGVTSFDDVLKKYYHQVSDEVGSFDLQYGLKYVRSYILAAQSIANNPLQPTWKAGDKYEAAWKKLFDK